MNTGGTQRNTEGGQLDAAAHDPVYSSPSEKRRKAREAARRTQAEAASDAYYDSGPRVDERLVDQNFTAQKGLSSVATDFSKKRERRGASPQSNTQYFDENFENQASRVGNAEYDRFERMRRFQEQKRIQQETLRARRRLTVQKARSVIGLARWGGLLFLFILYCMQLAFGAISLIGLGAWGAAEEIIKSSTVLDVVSKVASWFGVNLSTLIPFDYIGGGFWVLASIIGIMAFFGSLLMFYLTGAPFAKSEIDQFIIPLVFACVVMPVLNLFPAVFLWVLYVNVKSTLQLFSSGRKVTLRT